MKSPRTHFIIALIVAVAAVAIYATGYAALSSKSRDVADLQSRIDAARVNVSRIAAARAALAEIAGEEANVRGYFVPESGVVAFINALEDRGLALKTEVSVLSVSTGSGSSHQTLQLTLAIKGTFDAVMRTVGAIEYAPYDLSITGVSVGQDTKNKWHANLNIVVGSLPLAAATSTSHL